MPSAKGESQFGKRGRPRFETDQARAVFETALCVVPMAVIGKGFGLECVQGGMLEGNVAVQRAPNWTSLRHQKPSHGRLPCRGHRPNVFDVS